MSESSVHSQDGLQARDAGSVGFHALFAVQVAVIIPIGRNPSLHIKLTTEPTILLVTDTSRPFTGGLGASHLTTTKHEQILCRSIPSSIKTSVEGVGYIVPGICIGIDLDSIFRFVQFATFLWNVVS